MTTPIDERPALAMIHTVAGVVPVFNDLVGQHLPGWRAFNMLDESLLGNTIREGSLSAQTMRRLATLVWSARDAGASAVLVTCSSLGPAVDAAAPLCDVPVFRVDEGMAMEAVGRGGRIGVLATLSTTLDPTRRLIQRHAGARGLSVEIDAHLCEGAFDKLRSGDAAAHAALVRDGFASLADRVDVVVLAQASMANALKGVDGEAIPVLTSPKLGVLHVASALNPRTRVPEPAQG